MREYKPYYLDYSEFNLNIEKLLHINSYGQEWKVQLIKNEKSDHSENISNRFLVSKLVCKMTFERYTRLK